QGFHYVFLSQFHAVTVILTLIYLPFGKFFHIFQRPAQLGVSYYREAGVAAGQAVCIRCRQGYGSRLHMDDLKQLPEAVGIQSQLPGGAPYQDVCPACRRKNLALTQDVLWREERADAESER